jgi:YVTN family beta-propeller protein
MRACLSALVMLTSTLSAFAGQAPGAAEQPDIAVSEHDRFYTSDQFSNTVSVINPANNKLLGVIRLGDPTPGNLSPLCPWNGLLARSPNPPSCLDRIKLG